MQVWNLSLHSSDFTILHDGMIYISFICTLGIKGPGYVCKKVSTGLVQRSWKANSKDPHAEKRNGCRRLHSWRKLVHIIGLIRKYLTFYLEGNVVAMSVEDRTSLCVTAVILIVC